ncbi:MAG: rhomboid family intramembrane serine protease [Isosphaeraceae bacterium]
MPSVGAVMGIHDRDYYRDATRGSGWLAGVAPACKALILVNAAVFLLVVLDSSGQVKGWLQLTTEDLVRRGQIWRLMTAAFVHHDGWHIVINMLMLWFFGRDMESIYGWRDFLAMYLSAAVVGNLVWAGINLGVGDPSVAEYGASGAVLGVTALYTLYYPNREVLLFFFLPVPMWLLAVLYLGQDLVGLIQQVQGRSTAPVAFAAHLGGAGYGALYKLYDLRWSRLLGLMNPGRPRFRVVRADSVDPTREYPITPSPAKSVTASGASRSGPAVLQAQSEESLEERVDEILAKIARDGRGSVTEEEHRILQEASRRAQARRGERP